MKCPLLHGNIHTVPIAEILRGKNARAWVSMVLYLGVVHKLRGQDEVGRWSKNASFCPR